MRSPSVVAEAAPSRVCATSSDSSGVQSSAPFAPRRARRKYGVAAGFATGIVTEVSVAAPVTDARFSAEFAQAVLFVPQSSAPQKARSVPAGRPAVNATVADTPPETSSVETTVRVRSADGRRNEPSPGSRNGCIADADTVCVPVVFQPRPKVLPSSPAPAPPLPLPMRTSNSYQVVSSGVKAPKVRRLSHLAWRRTSDPPIMTMQESSIEEPIV